MVFNNFSRISLDISFTLQYPEISVSFIQANIRRLSHKEGPHVRYQDLKEFYPSFETISSNLINFLAHSDNPETAEESALPAAYCRKSLIIFEMIHKEK